MFASTMFGTASRARLLLSHLRVSRAPFAAHATAHSTAGAVKNKRVVIIGGVAGGASCATRLRRMDENAEVVIFDRGPHVSFANCGLPYYVGEVIASEGSLLQATPQLFNDRFRIDIRLRQEVVGIDRKAKTIAVRPAHAAPTVPAITYPYDALVLSPGAGPIRPPLKGIDLPGIFVLRTVPDSNEIRNWIQKRGAKSAVVCGGGFIGLEVAENLAHKGLKVTLVEKADQVMPPFDIEMAAVIKSALEQGGVDVRLNTGVEGFELANQQGNGLRVLTSSGAIDTDLVILALGVRPETGLAKAAGLQLGPRGGIKVDAHMRTSDPNIYAVGDAVEGVDFVTGMEVLVPLAGPAQRQGRVAADNICGRPSTFRGIQGTAVVGIFDTTAACTGETEKALLRQGRSPDSFHSVYLHPGHHAGYYPGATPIHMKIVFDAKDGRLLGAQAVGKQGIDKRIDVCAMCIQKHGTVYDLAEAELCYAPQYGSAKDPINVAGLIASNVLHNDAPLACWGSGSGSAACAATAAAAKSGTAIRQVVLDVREPDECKNEPIIVDLQNQGRPSESIRIPLHTLRERLHELPRDVELDVVCRVGQRSYYAVRLLRQHGFNAKLLSGGYLTWNMKSKAALSAAPPSKM